MVLHPVHLALLPAANKLDGGEWSGSQEHKFGPVAHVRNLARSYIPILEAFYSDYLSSLEVLPCGSFLSQKADRNAQFQG